MSDIEHVSKQWGRTVAWLQPGLSVKRWMGLLVVGAFLASVGTALVLDLHPIASTIRFLEAIAVHVPSATSGSILIIIGLLFLYIGGRSISTTFMGLIDAGGPNSDLFEAIYRQKKLSRGPRIVAIGGGTGLSTLLRGIKRYTSNITAVVTVGDDGGSSGRLRVEQGIIPPGDIRNCIAALSDEERMITELFQYRFKSGQGLEGHSFGNLFLTAMCHVTGDMISAIKESSTVLNIRGRVLPSTLDNVKLAAEMEDGTVVEGESLIPQAKGKIMALRCTPSCPKALPEVIEAIREADLILLGPGSLYTSVIPNLLIREIAIAVSQSNAPKLYIANIMTQPGETDGFAVGDHVKTILDHAMVPNVVNAVLVNNHLPDALVRKYADAGYKPVPLDTEHCQALGVQVVQQPLVDRDEHELIRHSPMQLAAGVMKWFKAEEQKKAPVNQMIQQSSSMVNQVVGSKAMPLDESGLPTTSEDPAEVGKV
ncbi:MAG: uridine diphosphate-N-acetylglucosamine-binding protein YvcK [Candidatus Melainabacteria bacterium]